MANPNKYYQHVNLGFDPYQVDQPFINDWYTNERQNYAQGIVDTWTPKSKGRSYGNQSHSGSFSELNRFLRNNTGFDDLYSGLDEYKRQGVYSNDRRGDMYNDFRQPTNSNLVAKAGIGQHGDEFLNLPLEQQQKFIHDQAKKAYEDAQEGSFLGNLLISPTTPLSIAAGLTGGFGLGAAGNGLVSSGNFSMGDLVSNAISLSGSLFDGSNNSNNSNNSNPLSQLPQLNNRSSTTTFNTNPTVGGRMYGNANRGGRTYGNPLRQLGTFADLKNNTLRPVPA